MTDPVGNVREALFAELVGDVQKLLDRIEQLGTMLGCVDEHAQATARTLDEANKAYRAQLDELMARLRAEFAGLVAQTTEHAAAAMVGQQTQVLQKAATAALRNALTEENVKRVRADWYRLIAIGALVGGCCAGVVASLVLVALR